jgi:tRNA pseudouridine55 synthase
MTALAAGVLVVAKVAGMTSFDVVAGVRRALRMRRVGHAGTLDPDATGVLPILLGEATKLMPYLADQDKEYRVTIRFGLSTDTLDVSGRVIAERPVETLDRAEIERAAARFIGVIKQVPPMYSARHHEGRRLYELAREGVEVEREPREVVVHGLSIDEVGESTATLTITCGKGTYVRVLASDLGEALGVGGCVESLVRTRVGPLGLDEAVSWEVVARGGDELRAHVLPPEAVLASWPTLRLTSVLERPFLCGQPVAATPAVARPGALVRVHAADGQLLGVGESVVGDRVRPIRILHVDRPGPRVLPA